MPQACLAAALRLSIGLDATLCRETENLGLIWRRGPRWAGCVWRARAGTGAAFAAGVASLGAADARSSAMVPGLLRATLEVATVLCSLQWMGRGGGGQGGSCKLSGRKSL